MASNISHPATLRMVRFLFVIMATVLIHFNVETHGRPAKPVYANQTDKRPPKAEQTAPTGSAKKKRTSFVETMLNFFGVTATTSLQKGVEDSGRGTVWICTSSGESKRPVTREGGFRSPIFLPGDGKLLALKDGNLVRITVASGAVEKLMAVDGALKIIGYEKAAPEQLGLLFSAGENKYRVVKLNLKTGQRTNISHDPKATEDQNLINYLSKWQRDYGAVRVFVKETADLSAREERTHIFIQREDGHTVNLTKGGEHNYGQPALSSDKSKVVYIAMDNR